MVIFNFSNFQAKFLNRIQEHQQHISPLLLHQYKTIDNINLNLLLDISSHFVALLENINFNHYLNDLRSETEFLSVSKKKLWKTGMHSIHLETLFCFPCQNFIFEKYSLFMIFFVSYNGAELFLNCLEYNAPFFHIQGISGVFRQNMHFLMLMFFVPCSIFQIISEFVSDLMHLFFHQLFCKICILYQTEML